jgi:hypothetical protein
MESRSSLQACGYCQRRRYIAYARRCRRAFEAATKALVDKLKALEGSVSAEKGPFLLFALFLREDAPDVWDLLVSAPWIEANKGAAFKYLATKLNQVATPEELTTLSRIVVIEKANPALAAIQSAMQIEHGSAEIQNSNFFGLHIKHAYIITSLRSDA